MYAQQYVENDLMDKSPVELIRLLYSKAVEKLDQAARHTRAGDVRGRNSSLARVMEIVAELQGSLDLDAGGELALDLARIYDYIQRRMIEAAADAKLLSQLEESRVLLGNLYEGWQECEPPAVPVESEAQPAQPENQAPQDAAEESGQNGVRKQVEQPLDAEFPSPPTAGEYSGAEESRVWTL